MAKRKTLLKPMGQGSGYAKVGFLGFPKSGKTYTAMLLAIGIRKHFGLDGPIAMFDTEGGAEYIARLVLKATGKALLGIRSRSFDDLTATARECESGAASVLIVDSITHPWRELMDAYLVKVNQLRITKGQGPKTRLALPDFMQLKALWAPWPEFYLNSKLHIVICGRAGFEWDMVENPETEQLELQKTGVKMKVEGEFGFEPSLLVEMERKQRDGKMFHIARVLGDRFDAIDGRECENPTFEFFRPHIELLTPGKHAPVDTAVKSDPDINTNGDAGWTREKRQRTINAEKIQGELVRVWPGQSAKEKGAKLNALEHAFQTRSWTEVENMPSEKQQAGLERLRATLAEEVQEATT